MSWTCHSRNRKLASNLRMIARTTCFGDVTTIGVDATNVAKGDMVPIVN